MSATPRTDQLALIKLSDFGFMNWVSKLFDSHKEIETELLATQAKLAQALEALKVCQAESEVMWHADAAIAGVRSHVAKISDAALQALSTAPATFVARDEPDKPDEITRLKQQVEALTKDKERMTWLENRNWRPEDAITLLSEVNIRETVDKYIAVEKDK